MKRILCALMAAALVLCLGGCADPDTTAQAPGFQAGFGRTSITPDTSVPLAGREDSLSRMSQGILDMLYVTCVALTDQSGTTVLLLSLDLHTLPDDIIPTLRSAVTRSTGVSAEQIILTATNTHSGPDLTATYSNHMSGYRSFLRQAVANAAQSAMDDRAPATIKTGSVKAADHCFARYPYEGFPEEADFTGKLDQRARLIRLSRDKKKDILLMNWQVPPDLASADNAQTRALMSADFVGSLRSYIEKQAGVRFAYFQGAGADLTSAPLQGGPADLDRYAQSLAEAVADKSKNLKNAKAGVVLMTRQIFDRAGLTMELSALRIGDISFITAPCGIYDEDGRYIRDNGPFSSTFILGYANGWSGEIPSARAIDQGYAETTLPGTTSKSLADTFLEMLQRLQ